MMLETPLILAAFRWSRSRSSTSLEQRARPRTAHSASGPSSGGCGARRARPRKARPRAGGVTRTAEGIPRHPLTPPSTPTLCRGASNEDRAPNEDRSPPVPRGPHAPCGTEQLSARPWPRPGPAHSRPTSPVPANHHAVRPRGGRE